MLICVLWCRLLFVSACRRVLCAVCRCVLLVVFVVGFLCCFCVLYGGVCVCLLVVGCGSLFARCLLSVFVVCR